MAIVNGGNTNKQQTTNDLDDLLQDHIDSLNRLSIDVNNMLMESEDIVNNRHNHENDHQHNETNGGGDDEENIKNRFTHVRALHNFRGTNNDELCLKKDDIITLTQTPSGGWWEGTLDGITGWFPSNYVSPLLPSDPLYQQIISGASGSRESTDLYGYSSPTNINENNTSQWMTSSFNAGTGSGLRSLSPEVSGYSSLEHQQQHHLAEYRLMVMKCIEDSETQFIQSLQDAINHYLMPIYQYKILPKSCEHELNAVLRSITEICTVHRRFLNSIEKIKNVPHKENRIGGLFMQYAPQFKHAHFEYCSHHSRFVHVIEKYKQDICQFFQQQKPQIPIPASLAQTLASPSHQHHLTGSSNGNSTSNPIASMPNVQITALLSVSFRRLDKYPALLQELQRYTEENHVDRGDIQRAGFVYREISMSCLELRRRKEMELEVMLGNIKNFDNIQIDSYGQIIKMEPVSILLVPSWSEPKKDCYLVLFPKILMILSVGKEMTSFTFESMIRLEGAKLPPLNIPVTGPDGSLLQTYPMELHGQNAHPYQTEPEQLSLVVGFPTEDVLREYYQALQKQIRHQTNVTTSNVQQSTEQQQQSSMSMSSSASVVPSGGSAATGGGTGTGTGGALSSSSSTSSNIFSSPPVSITSPDQPVPASLPPKPPSVPVISSGGHHRPPPPAPPTCYSIEYLCETLPKRTSYWQEQLLTAHIPYYRPMELVPGQIPIQIGPPPTPTPEQESPQDDMQLLNVIDSYHRIKFGGKTRIGSGSGLVNRKISNPELSSSSSMESANQPPIELEPYHYVDILGTTKPSSDRSHQSTTGGLIHRNPSTATKNARKNSLTMLANKINKLSLSSMDRDILYEIYDQLRVIRNEMSHLSEKVRDERRQRKRIQHSLQKVCMVAARWQQQEEQDI